MPRGPVPRRPRAAALALLAAVGGCLAPPRLAAAGDTLVLVSGTKLEGRVVSETPDAVVFELAGGRTRMTVGRAQVAAIERGPVGELPVAPTAPTRAARDEWYLLKALEKTVGVRHLVVRASDRGDGTGWRFEEELVFVGQGRTPTVRVERVEETTADFRPVHLHYVERGDAGELERPYELVRVGPVADGVWDATVRVGPKQEPAPVTSVAGVRSPLALREALVRATPRAAGLVEVPLLDPGRGTARTVRAGFTALDAGGGPGRVDVLRIEDGDRAVSSRWGPGDPPRCLEEEVAPGVVAVPATREAAEAAMPAPPPRVDPRTALRPASLGPPRKPDLPSVLTLPDVGVELTLPAGGWAGEVVPAQGEDVGSRVVARGTLRAMAADVRVEWDPKGARGDAAAAEATLLERLRRVCPDLRIVRPRAAVPGVAGGFRLTLAGTVRREALVTWALVADRGAGRVTVLVAAPASAEADVAPAVEAIFASFRRL